MLSHLYSLFYFFLPCLSSPLHEMNSVNSFLYLRRSELHRISTCQALSMIRRPWHAPTRCLRKFRQRVGLRLHALMGAGTAVPRLRFSHFVLLSMVTPPSSTGRMPESFVCRPNRLLTVGHSRIMHCLASGGYLCWCTQIISHSR